jgi:hypothetical protein
VNLYACRHAARLSFTAKKLLHAVGLMHRFALTRGSNLVTITLILSGFSYDGPSRFHRAYIFPSSVVQEDAQRVPKKFNGLFHAQRSSLSMRTALGSSLFRVPTVCDLEESRYTEKNFFPPLYVTSF